VKVISRVTIEETKGVTIEDDNFQLNPQGGVGQQQPLQ